MATTLLLWETPFPRYVLIVRKSKTDSEERERDFMLKRIGILALVLSASAGFFEPASAFAQEYYYGDRDYRAEDHRDGSRWREHRGEERYKHGWSGEHRRNDERRWREHRWREEKWRHESREHERAERRYYNRHHYSPYGEGYYYPR
ncbi:MAG: hypothetical protein ACJ74Z_04260 [Bryobacteraceae bacterium]|jgi:hypothetical protein